MIRSRRVVLDGEVRAAAIETADGRVVAIRDWNDVPADLTLRDFGDDVIMPGIVDSHVHVNEPGRTAWEGFETATRAAAAGGITTIIDMPLNSVPPTTSVDAVAAKVAAMRGKLSVDVGLWGGAVPENLDRLAEVRDAGVLGFKCFLVDSGVPEFGYLNREQLATAVRAFDGLGVPLLVHAELAEGLYEPAPSTPASSYSTYLQTRSPRAEDRAIALLCSLAAKATDVRVHVVHLSSASAVPILADARARGVQVTAETTPHYLALRAEEIPEGATEYKCAPPIRDEMNREKLWSALGAGDIDMIVSDHSPSPPDMKAGGDFLRAWGGISSLQLTLPVIWSDASTRGFALTDLARWMCEEPAKLAGVAHRKGSIRVGADADFVIWSPEKSFVVEPSAIEHRHKLTPYIGRTLRGAVRETILRGETIFADGVHAEQRRGVWIRGNGT